jgi:hypothetical protein
MPNFWQEIWNFFHRPKVQTVEVVITIRDKQHHRDSAYAQFKIKEGSHGSHH